MGVEMQIIQGEWNEENRTDPVRGSCSGFSSELFDYRLRNEAAYDPNAIRGLEICSPIRERIDRIDNFVVERCQRREIDSWHFRFV